MLPTGILSCARPPPTTTTTHHPRPPRAPAAGPAGQQPCLPCQPLLYPASSGWHFPGGPSASQRLLLPHVAA